MDCRIKSGNDKEEKRRPDDDGGEKPGNDK
jgi:hypothetical protein